MNIGKLKLGFTNGEEESRVAEFSQYYYDHNNIVEKSLDPRIYIVLGRRGTGKTALSFYLDKNLNSHSHYLIRISYKELTPANFRRDNHEIKSGSLYQLFRWMFLLEMSKAILIPENSEVFTGMREYKILKELGEMNYEFKMPNKPSLISQIINNGIKIKFGGLTANTSLGELEFNPGVQGQLTHKSVPLFYEHLFEIIKPLLRKAREAGYQFTILIDDVDDHLSSDEESKRILEDLVNVIYGFNGEIRNYHNESKIMLFLRSDIFNRITISNRLKIRDDHSLLLSWGVNSDMHSSLLDLIVKRLKINHEEFCKKGYSHEVIIKKLFPANVIYTQDDGRQKDIEGYTFILKRTHFRPRDLIRYLRFMQTEFKDLGEFGSYAILKCERQFSDWLKSDIEDELRIHYNQEYIANLMGIASRLKTWRFGFQRLKKSFEQRYETPSIDLEEALIVLYKFGVLGQFFTNESGESTINYFYNDEDIPYNNANFFLNDFVVHQGLRTSLLKGDARKARQFYS